MEPDHECQSHPIRFVFKTSNTALDFLVGDFAFFSGRDFCDAQFSNGIGTDHTSLHGDPHDLAKKLGVSDGRIPPTEPMACYSALPPENEFRAVSKLNHSRVREPRDGEPMLDVLPSIELSMGGFFISPVGFQPASHPAPPLIVR